VTPSQLFVLSLPTQTCGRLASLQSLLVEHLVITNSKRSGPRRSRRTSGVVFRPPQHISTSSDGLKAVAPVRRKRRAPCDSFSVICTFFTHTNLRPIGQLTESPCRAFGNHNFKAKWCATFRPSESILTSSNRLKAVAPERRKRRGPREEPKQNPLIHSGFKQSQVNHPIK